MGSDPSARSVMILNVGSGRIRNGLSDHSMWNPVISGSVFLHTCTMAQEADPAACVGLPGEVHGYPGEAPVHLSRR